MSGNQAPNVGGWTLPASILAGSIIIGVFEPLLLLVGIGALIWLGMLHRSYSGQLQHLEQDRLGLDHRLTQANAISLLLGSVLNSADVPIIATNNAGTIIQANRAAQEVLGSGRPLISEHFESLITQATVQQIEQLARTGESGHARLELPVGGDMRVFDVAADQIAGTQGAVCTFTDITELSSSATLKADFAANASHELRTPIAAILGAIETIEGPARDDPEMTQRLIGMISANASRLDLMVKDLLDLSKLESTLIPTQLTQIDIAEIIDRSSGPFVSVCDRRDLSIQTQIDERAMLITSDDSLLELILRNLIGNATKFARGGTVVSIHVEPVLVGIDPDAPPPEGMTGSMGVRISVRDEGIGIPLSQQTRIFERFYQVDEARDGSSARRGTGLGLAIVKHAARTLGGTIRVKSVHQQGTTMIVELPNCVAGSQ